jgi:hypothetical protein
MPVLSLRMQIERVGDRWLGTAPWCPDPVEGDTFEEVFWLLRARRFTSS